MSKKPKTKSASVIGDRVYDTTRIRDKDGKLRFSRGNGDAVAKAMLLHKSQGGDIDQVIRANKLEERMKGKSKMQDGLKRMCVGVMLRALVRNGTPVKIGKIVIEKLTQKVEMPKVLPAGDKPKPKPAKKALKAKKTAAPRKRRAKTIDEIEQDQADDFDANDESAESAEAADELRAA